MLNLLPQEEQKKLLREYHLRFAAVTLGFLCAIEFVAFVTLLPSLVLSYGKSAAVTQSDELLKQEVARRAADNSAIVMQLAREKAAATGTATGGSPRFYSLIADVVADRTSAIAVTGFTMSRAAGGAETLSIEGRAADRDKLLAFAQKLQKETVFAHVDVPVSNFADAQNIAFSILTAIKQ